MTKETKRASNSLISDIESTLIGELFALNHTLANEGFDTVCQQMDVAIKVGELARAVKALRNARTHISYAVDGE